TSNIGVMSHSYAGKTPTTECILYYSARSQKIREAYEGASQMECMEQERGRGITITSAGRTAGWEGNRVNIIR
ncbi:GTP-binding protein, partial [Staphylococcus aureus]